MVRFIIPVQFVRRMPDPIFSQCERHMMLCAVNDLPKGLPTDPNPRNAHIDRMIWREIQKHLLNDEGTPNTFHLKNKGITLLAERVRKLNEEKVELLFEPGQGIVDGGHTYALLMENLGEIEDRNTSDEPDFQKISQFVELKVLTGYPRELIPEISGGLNTGLQVQDISLMELQDAFQWIKDELDGQRYANEIAFREGESAPYDVRDIIALLDLFNVSEFPNDGTTTDHPVRAYNQKSVVLASYKANRKHYEQLRPILKDILTLHDMISLGALDEHNKAGGKARSLTFIEKRKRGQFNFVFTGKKSTARLFAGALFPMLAAFRWMVKINRGRAEWRGGFSAVKSLWAQTAAELMKATQSTSEELGRKPHAIGRSRNHWANLYKTVAAADLMRNAA